MSSKVKKPREKADIGPVLVAFGPISLSLKQKFVLPVVTFLGAVVAVLAPFLWPEWEWWTPVRVAAGVAAAVAIILDRIADSYEKRLAAVTFRESERSAEKAIDNVNIFISEAIEAMFLEGSARTEAIKTLRRTVARTAAGCVGDGSRASYYPLRREQAGSRILDTPFHATEHGRYDKPERPFVEREDPNHEVWKVLDRADEETEVRSEGEEVYGVDWNKKKYKTFYSVPVKANMVQLGFLSVNNAKAGSIGGPQRAAVLAMARTMALVLASHKGAKFLNTQAGYRRVSGVDATVYASTEEKAK